MRFGKLHEVEPSTLAVHIRWLREKIEQDPANPEILKTVWAKGTNLSAKKRVIRIGII